MELHVMKLKEPKQPETIERIRFWMVWHENGGSPRVKHWNKQNAMEEAERLAKANPGKTFLILKATGGAIADAPPIKRVRFMTCM
ncbi:hypothetical protein GN330_22910 [Nitratireductor sp. CAU 1489]|uniref:Uncharacterized protein n=1 Tax=Nitratireductor arenosus TaxID=2682096 RepID=A0A844QQ54_9HYPH|nr:hypothetical protein [Nitratireductor arenosus]MVB00101.1 hypothetical protein [Nitratireductor arenosus]